MTWFNHGGLAMVATLLVFGGCARQYNDFGPGATDGQPAVSADTSATELMTDSRTLDLALDARDIPSDAVQDSHFDVGADGLDVLVADAGADANDIHYADSSITADVTDAVTVDIPDIQLPDTVVPDVLDVVAPIDANTTDVAPEIVSSDTVEEVVFVGCGDDKCAVGETCQSCPADCGVCPYCGDSNCDPGEDCENCVNDCACIGEAICFEQECCTAQCVGKECGGDGCGGQCGVCPGDKTCDANTCVEETMVVVPASNFCMGCNDLLDLECDPDEYPQHSVNVPEFSIDVTQVSLERYTECVDFGPCDPPAPPLDGCVWGKEGKENHPMNCVTWEAADIFCKWANKRLCREAEWEKAARGGCEKYVGICSEVMPKYPWGNDPISCAYANYFVGGAGCGSGSVPVDMPMLGDSPYGTLHMVGNLWDWVEDCYHSSYQNAPTDGAAWNGDCAPGHSLRGGSLWSGPAGVRCSSRHPGDGAFSVHTAGFRCCKDP